MKQLYRFMVMGCLALLCTAVKSQALDSQLIEVDLGREYGLFSKSPALLRAVSVRQDKTQPRAAVLFFVGWPGQLWIPEKVNPERFAKAASKVQLYAMRHFDFFPSKGITFVAVDCPTDQWGGSFRSPNPTGCSDLYRASEQHASDVGLLIKRLKETQGIEKIYIFGHSYGSVSSRWLAIRLGDQIQGSIHSASMSVYAGPRYPDYGSSIAQIDMSQASAPWIFFHHQDDRCPATAYAPVQAVAGSQLTTVRGGLVDGDPCGGGHLHSYQGRELVVLEAMANWILTGTSVQFVGEPE
jgi:pimeloyl-ACP methyl ester carboxylesterase